MNPLFACPKGSSLFCIIFIVPMNPCPCGYYPDRNRCNCSEESVRKYLNKISQPLLDRIDLCTEVSEITYDQIAGKEKKESSAEIRKRVTLAHKIQKERFRNRSYRFNSEIPAAEIDEFCIRNAEVDEILQKAFTALHLTGRGYHRVLKVARTIADMDQKEKIQAEHIREALGYRMVDKKYWR